MLHLLLLHLLLLVEANKHLYACGDNQGSHHAATPARMLEARGAEEGLSGSAGCSRRAAMRFWVSAIALFALCSSRGAVRHRSESAHTSHAAASCAPYNMSETHCIAFCALVQLWIGSAPWCQSLRARA